VNPYSFFKDDFLLDLRDVAEAKGIARLARRTRLNRENRHRMLAKKGNPQLSSLTALLKSLGLKLAVEVEEHAVA
jgi:probable addiction module antidote protein